MADVHSHFCKVSESDILRIQDSIPENTKKAMKFGLKVFKGWKRLIDVQLCSSSRTCPWQSQTMNLSKPEHQVALHLTALAVMNTARFIGRSIKYYSRNYPNVFAQENIQFFPKSRAHGIISGRFFANYSFSFHFK